MNNDKHINHNGTRFNMVHSSPNKPLIFLPLGKVPKVEKPFTIEKDTKLTKKLLNYYKKVLKYRWEC